MPAREDRWVAPPGSIPTLTVPSLSAIRCVHLVGIGGAGMRNLARLFLARGLEVHGSDLKDARALDPLREQGATIWIGHRAAHVVNATRRPDVVITSSAIGDANSEVRAAVEAGIPIWRRQQALAALTGGRRTISVSGTHGKTTTTSLLARTLEYAGLDPSYLIGGDLNETGGGARHGAGDLFVFEADESDGSFLLGTPWTGVITNIDVDHLDFYPGGLPEIEAAFGAFAAACSGVVACGDDPAVRRALERAAVVATTYGTGDEVDLQLTVEHLGPEGARGRVRSGDEDVAVTLQVDGAHNLLNATAVLGAAARAGVPMAVAAEAMASFEGVHRRFELRGTARGADFYDDYGHTPTEMAVTLATARRRDPRRLIALVQPHRYQRVQALWRELGASVATADLVVITDIYGASQPPIPGVTARMVADGVALAASDARTVYLPHRGDVVAFLADEIASGDLIVTMGCGDVWMLGDAVRERIMELDG